MSAVTADPNEPQDYDGYVDYITNRAPGLDGETFEDGTKTVLSPMRHFLVVTNSGATVGFRHESCSITRRMDCPYEVAWQKILRHNNADMPQPTAFEMYGDGEHEMQLTIFGDLQGKDTKVPWRVPVVED